MTELEFINARMSGVAVEVPPLLYKYRPFDGFTFDMLENKYIYLCAAKDLDDPSECKAVLSIEDFIDTKTLAINYKCVEMILELIRSCTSEENYQKLRHSVFRAVRRGRVSNRILLDISSEIQELVPDCDITLLTDFLAVIPEKLNNPKIKEQIENLIELTYNAREKMGICSLTTEKNNGDMWKNYADNASGYCIEYSMEDYEHLPLLYPVVYNDFREVNIVKNILSSFIFQSIYGMSYGQANVDRSQLIRMFLTKDCKWAYQKEWRLLGDAGDKLPAPKVSKIYLGENMPHQNKIEFIKFCDAHGIAFE